MENRDGSRKQTAKAVLKASDNLLCNKRNLGYSRTIALAYVRGRKTSLREEEGATVKRPLRLDRRNDIGEDTGQIE
ncbi:hypothetical protein ALC60_02549 [Trachymyrmex zeteki]|uniref:Uncharacterized protein n=1 Tax=Mycetomoellerius zeteki TaxID=64791 RepID=A0A151XDR3_9HYME|nr:hypothetical protein ALC60_02549 [Trachymyrmex zeteki]